MHDFNMQKHVCSLINSALPAKQFGPRTGSHQRLRGMSDSMPHHVHSLSHCTQDVLLPPNLPHLSLTSEVTKLSPELFSTIDKYVTYIKLT